MEFVIILLIVLCGGMDDVLKICWGLIRLCWYVVFSPVYACLWISRNKHRIERAYDRMVDLFIHGLKVAARHAGLMQRHARQFMKRSFA